MTTLKDKFRGCLLGASMGDIAGAAVEAESPGYIARTYRSVDEILATPSVPEFVGPDWQVGRYTDDTQMMLCVAEWLLDGPPHGAESLLSRFAEAYEPWRRYGPGTELILRLYPEHHAEWRQLATAQFPSGSFGNGSAMRVAPVGLAYFQDQKTLASVATESSRPTHCHPVAFQGAVLQSTAVATAVTSTEIVPEAFLSRLRAALADFADLLQDTTAFARALASIEDGLEDGRSCQEMASALGTGVAAHEAVPMALYCFLRHPDSYERVLHEAIFLGGDTDTIACMAGAISGAFLGAAAIPANWLAAVREDKYPVAEIERLADRLFERYGGSTESNRIAKPRSDLSS
ncbi:MAG TPA: ADP-ribosylglycohydrolase family protein [Tepidisphaeraceae bacterium]|jgi:poly(ADP-ribose) glycohydrolase ARH3